MLLGGDILQGGRSPDLLNFSGWEQKTIGEGRVHGSVKFERRGVTYSCALDHCPAEGVAIKHV